MEAKQRNQILGVAMLLLVGVVVYYNRHKIKAFFEGKTPLSDRLGMDGQPLIPPIKTSVNGVSEGAVPDSVKADLDKAALDLRDDIYNTPRTGHNYANYSALAYDHDAYARYVATKYQALTGSKLHDDIKREYFLFPAYQTAALNKLAKLGLN